MNNLIAQENRYNYEHQQIIQLKAEISFLKTFSWGLGIVILLMAIIIFLQRVLVGRLRKELSGGSGKSVKRPVFPSRKKPEPANEGKSSQAQAVQTIKPKDLPDPGLMFKYSLASENVLEKEIVIGQTEGNIKTYSTEIIDHHLSVLIRILENRRDQDIYDLPDTIIEEYQVYLRREGKAMIFYPGLEGFQEMSTRERIYIKQSPDESGDLTFKGLDPKQPIRLRLGDRLNQDGKFVNGFFEFHLMTQDYEAKTKAGIKKIEKNFFLRLYKIYPGYDTAAQTSDGLFPMIDPFATGRS